MGFRLAFTAYLASLVAITGALCPSFQHHYVHQHSFRPLSLRKITRPSTSTPVMMMTPAELDVQLLGGHMAALQETSSMLLGTTAADYEFSGSYASLYATLALYAISFPGLYSLVKRSVKIKFKQRTYELAGPNATTADAKPVRQVAAEIMAYWQANNFQVVDAGETIVFKGVAERSKSQAFFLSFCALVGVGTLALVLSIQVPTIGPIEIGNWWYLMSLISPFAGIYYWTNAERDNEVRLRLETTDDLLGTEVTIQAGEEELDRFATIMNYNEKGKVRVRGLLERDYAPEAVEVP